MTTIAHVSTAMQTVVTTLATQAGADVYYTRRPDQAKFTASTLVQTLVFGWLAHPDATLEQLTQMAARVGVDVQPQAIDQRFTPATATLLQTVLTRSVSQMLASDPVVIPILQRFTGVRIHDSTTIVLPDALADHYRGCGGSTATNTSAALKCGVQIDLLTGVITGLDLVDGRAADQRLPIQHLPIPPGALRIADLGFWTLDVLAEIDTSGGYWLSKADMSTCVSDATHDDVTLLRFVQDLGVVDEWEGDVLLGKDHRLPARMIIRGVPQEVADQRRRRIRKEARDKGRAPSTAALSLAAWTILVTNVPSDLLTLREAVVVMKVRWQIELVCTLWKSHGQIDTWRSGKPMRILCEIYAKLLGMLLHQWVFLVGCWTYPDRSLVKAAQVVRDHAPELAGARGCPTRLAETLETIQRVLRRTARINPRRTRPNTYHLVLALTPTDPIHTVS